MTAVPTDPYVRSFLHDKCWAPTTTKSAIWHLNDWCAWLAAADATVLTATRHQCETYLETRLADGRAPATVQVGWRMMKALHAWLAAEEETDTDPMRRVKAPTVSETPVMVLSEIEYRRLVETCDRRTVMGRRDEAIMSLLWGSGLRRAEIVGLNLDDYDEDHRRIVVGTRTFATKTRTSRRVPLSAGTVSDLDRYLRRRGREPGPLFLSLKGGHHDDRRLDPNSITLMLTRRSRRAGIGRVVGAHEFRRALAIRSKRSGMSTDGLMAVAGWSSERMVGRYTRMEREELAAEEFHRLFDGPRSTATARRRGRRVS